MGKWLSRVIDKDESEGKNCQDSPKRSTDKTDKTYVTEGGSVSFAVSREKETSAVNAQNEVLPVPRFRGATSETAIEEGTL